jgi:hypothetical protein
MSPRAFRPFNVWAIPLVIAGLCSLASGAAAVLDFEGLADNEPVGAFYNGGEGGLGSGPGANLGVEFSSNALALVDEDAPGRDGSGNFGGEPSPDTALFFLTGTAATMTVSAGFTDGFSFFYSATSLPGTIVVHSGPAGTGEVLATLALGLTPSNGAPDPTGTFSPFVARGVSFDGVAHSVDFGGTINRIGFDNITFGSATPTPGTGTPIPLPSGLPAGLGLLGLAMLVASARGRHVRFVLG